MKPLSSVSRIGGAVRQSLACASLALAAALVAGCSSSDADRLEVVPVEGQLVFENKTTPGAFVVLHPLDNGAAGELRPTGYVDENGKFSVTTYERGDGAPAGEYAVTVEWRKLVAKDGEVQAGPNVLPQKYARAGTTDLRVHVAEGQPAAARLELKRR